MIRRLFTVASTLSLLLFTAAIAFWIRGHIVADVLNWDGEVYLYSSSGMFGEIIDYSPSGGYGRPQGFHYSQAPPWHGGIRPLPNGFAWQRLGLAFGSDPDDFLMRLVAVPWWLVATAFAVLPVVRLLSARWRVELIDPFVGGHHPLSQRILTVVSFVTLLFCLFCAESALCYWTMWIYGLEDENGIAAYGEPTLHREADLHSAWLWTTLGITAAILPLARLPRILRARRETRKLARAGLCNVCGYDLRASIERCPECGTVIAAKIRV